MLDQIHGGMIVGGGYRVIEATRYAEPVVAATLSARRVPTIIPLVITVLAATVAVALGYGLYVLALAALLPVLLLIFQRPQRGVLLLAALAPFSGLLLILPFPDFVNGWKEFLVGTTLVATFLCPPDERAPGGRSLPRWLPAVIGLALLGLFSATMVGGQQALEGLKVNYFYFLLAVAIWRCPLTSRDRDRLVTTLMAAGFVVSVVGLAQQVIGPTVLHDLGYDYGTTIRTTSGAFLLRSFSTFGQPFPFALFVMTVLLLGLAIALADQTRLRNRLFLLATPVYVLGILSAFVRASWLGLAAGLLYLGFKRYRILLVGFPIGLIVFLFVGSSVTDTLLSTTSLQARQTGWEANIEKVQQHPFGVGIGSSGVVSEIVNTSSSPTTTSSQASSSTSPNVYQPDNYYFKTLYELGVLGLWFLLLLLVSLFRNFNALGNRLRSVDSAFADGVAAIVLAAMAASLVATYFEIFPLDMYFWMLVGTTAALAAERPRERARGALLGMSVPSVVDGATDNV